jgi:hypothetical protein
VGEERRVSLEADGGDLANKGRYQGRWNSFVGCDRVTDTLRTLSERRLRIGRVGVWLGPGFAGKQLLHGIDGV